MITATHHTSICPHAIVNRLATVHIPDPFFGYIHTAFVDNLHLSEAIYNALTRTWITLIGIISLDDIKIIYLSIIIYV